jgi:hypothetical protein
MKNIFNLNEEEKKRIKRLHQINEDAGMDTPGGNPDYFYDEDSVLSKLKKQRDQEVEMSKDDVIGTVVEIYSLLQDGAPAIATRRIEELLYKLGHFKN